MEIQPTRSLFWAYTSAYFSKAVSSSGSGAGSSASSSVGSSTSPLTKSATSAKASALCFWSRYSRASIAPEKRNRAAQRAAPAIISLLFTLSLMFHPSLCLSRLFFPSRLAALPLWGRLQPPQLGFYGRFFAACFFRKASCAALHLG